MTPRTEHLMRGYQLSNGYPGEVARATRQITDPLERNLTKIVRP